MSAPGRVSPPAAAATRAVRFAALTNAAVVLTLPLALSALDRWISALPRNSGTTVTAHVSSWSEYTTQTLVHVGSIIAWTLPFALIAAWRTWVHARRRQLTGDSGWRGVIEAGALGLGVALAMMLPGMLTQLFAISDAALFAAGAYAIAAGAIGLLVGAMLRYTALFALWIAQHVQPHPLVR